MPKHICIKSCEELKMTLTIVHKYCPILLHVTTLRNTTLAPLLVVNTAPLPPPPQYAWASVGVSLV